LTEYKVEHIILEARDRIGGRITNVPFEGTHVELGAEYVHAKSKKALKVIMEDLDWDAERTNEEEHFLYEGHGELDSDIQENARDLHDKLL
jgi:protoporphyrinogen oxidase